MARQYSDQPAHRPAQQFACPPSQSSIAVVCRAVVMLGCLVLIPLAALFGTKLPGIVEDFRGGGWAAATESARQALSEAPPFQSAPFQSADTGPAAMNPTDGFRPGPAWRNGPTEPTGPPGSPGPTPSNGYPIVGAATDQGYRTGGAAAPRGPASRGPAPGEPLPGPRAAVYSAATSPATGQEAMLAGYESRIDPAPTFDRFTYIQRRLRQLGATYYLLESWGAEGEYFRFHCRMAVGGNEDYTRHFEATEGDALEAMARVLSEVEAWRGGW